MRASTVIAGVLAQLQKLFDIEVPAFQIGADRALALAALVHRHGRVIHHFQEGHHALRLAIGALDVAAQGAHARPVVAQATGELGQQRVFLDGFVDAVQIVRHRGEVAAGQLRTARAAVEQRGRAAHEVEGGQHLVELDGTRLALDLVQRQPHGHAHEEGLWQLDAALLHVQEVAVVQGLQAEVVELVVALGLKGGAELLQVELQQFFVQQFGLHSLLDELREVVGITRSQLLACDLLAQHLTRHGVQQQACGDVGVVRIQFDLGACGEDGSLVHFRQRHAVIEVAQGFADDGIGLHLGTEPGAGAGDQAAQRGLVQRNAHTIVHHMQHRRSGLWGRLVLGAFLGALFAVQHIGAGDFVVVAAHQLQLDLVLHILDVEGAAAGTRTQQRLDHALRQLLDHLAHGAGCGTLRTMHRQKGLGHGHRDLLRLERHHGAIAADDLVVGVRGSAGGLSHRWNGTHWRLWSGRDGVKRG